MPDLHLTGVESELTTAATDALLTVVVAAGIAWLCRRVPPSPRRTLWVTGFALFAAAGALGAFVHGFDLDPPTRALLWQPLYLTLGSALAFFTAGAIGDWKGDIPARRALPFLLAAALGFYALTRLSGGKFLVFVIFEAAALLLALAVYARLAVAGKRGAALVAAGLVLSLAGGALQASSLSLHLVWDFNHNGLYHLVQLVGVVFLLAGLRGTLSVPQP
jgi:Family of unknown function (DUF6962)